MVCVRGGRAFGSWPLEKEACERLQLDLHKVAIRARQAPRKQDLLDLIDLLSSLSYPALIHCKSGADRTGFVAAVYLIAVKVVRLTRPSSSSRCALAIFATRGPASPGGNRSLWPRSRR